MKLVSIVSPCYNGESYIGRYFNAILAQTYRPLELILVNDGSTDRTDEIVSEYREKLKESDILFKYIKKNNEGLGAAINDGLKLTTGDYLIWPDTDDFLFPQSIEKRVQFLEEHPEYGFVYSDGNVYEENYLDIPARHIKSIIPNDGYLFENVVSGNVVYTPCGYMLRMSAFLDVNPQKDIYPSRYGQDIQMLLPISKKYRCGYIKEVLYGRVDRPGSLSKKVWNESDTAWKDRILGLEQIYVETLKRIGGDALAYIPYIYYRDLRILMATARNVGKKPYAEQRKVLIKAMKLLVMEIAKTVFNLVKS